MPAPLDDVRRLAAQHGFDLWGVAAADRLGLDLARLSAWCDAGHGADLGWMTRAPPERADPRHLLRTVRTVLSFAAAHATAAPPFASEGRYGRVARYAWGLDYHAVLKPRLRRLARDLARTLSAGRAYVAVDDAPILERAWAARSGVGFVGKNTCLIAPRRGSWFLLGEILLDVDLAAEAPEPSGGGCGTCVRCLDACPTGALPAPFVLDSGRCISYLTIEHRGSIPEELRPRMGAWAFGCDVCQEVCPWQRAAAAAPWPELDPEAGIGPRLDLVATLALATEEEFAARFAGTALLRPRREGLLRNAAVVARNVNAVAAVPNLIVRATEDPSAVVREHALWALEGLDPDAARRVASQAASRGSS